MAFNEDDEPTRPGRRWVIKTDEDDELPIPGLISLKDVYEAFKAQGRSFEVRAPDGKILVRSSK